MPEDQQLAIDLEKEIADRLAHMEPVERGDAVAALETNLRAMLWSGRCADLPPMQVLHILLSTWLQVFKR